MHLINSSSSRKVASLDRRHFLPLAASSIQALHLPLIGARCFSVHQNMIALPLPKLQVQTKVAVGSIIKLSYFASWRKNDPSSISPRIARSVTPSSAPPTPFPCPTLALPWRRCRSRLVPSRQEARRVPRARRTDRAGRVD